jgi:hypothetical protein
LKIVVPQPTYHLWKKFVWVLRINYWLDTTLLVSIFLKVYWYPNLNCLKKT